MLFSSSGRWPGSGRSSSPGSEARVRGYFGTVGLLALVAIAVLASVQSPRAPRMNGSFPAADRPILSAAQISRPGSFSIPSSFEPNFGQAHPRAQFIGRGKGMAVLLTGRGIELQASSRAGRNHGANRSNLRIDLAGANKRSLVWRGDQRLPALSNYFLGSNPKLWRTAVPHFARAAALEAMPGVDMLVHVDGDRLEYDLDLAPGTNAERLRLKVSGAEKTELDSDGGIVMRAAGREFRMQRPVTYQETGGTRKALDCRYIIARDGTIRFALGPHDRNARVVIDPILSVLYSTFLGGAGEDSANSMAMDAQGNLYIGGTTTLASFPQSDTALGPGGGAADYFVAKIDPTKTGLNSLVYLTFLGGSGNESGGLIAVDSSGDVAITGVTDSTDFPVTDSTKRTAGANDVTLSEIDPTGAKLLFSTLFGGSGAEATQNGGGIAISTTGNIFVTSDTTSTDLPITAGALESAFNSSSTDGFLAVFSPSGTAGATPALKYCTYLGFNAQVGVTSIAVDSNGVAYLTGFTSDPGSSFTTTNGVQSTYGGGDFDAFLMKINPAGTGANDLAYATLLGGSGSDQAFAVAVDSSTPPTAYVTGTTNSVNFPVNGTLAPFQSTLNQSINASNAFVSVVTQDPNTLATSLRYSTYLGGSQTDTGLALALSTSNAGQVIYVAGATISGDFPALDNFQPFNGDQDAFLAKLVPGLGGKASLVFSTPLGGTAMAGGTALAQANAVLTDGNGNIYLAGGTTAPDFPRAGNPMNGAQVVCSSCQQAPPAADAFVTEVAEASGTTPALIFKTSGGASNLNFGNANIGSQNVPPQPVAVFNSGDAVLSISGIAIAGANANDFPPGSLQACLGASLMPQQQCSFEIGFVPSVAGPEEAFVSVTDNAPGSSQLLALVGFGNGAVASPSPATVDFGTVAVGLMPTMTVTLSNTGNQGLMISQVQIGGTNPKEFAQVHGSTCGAGITLGAGQSCFVTVQFLPDAAQTFHAEIDFTDNSQGAAGPKQIVPLMGTGSNQPQPPIVNLSPASLAFSNQAVSTSSAVQSVTLTNTGSGPLNVTGISITGADAGSFGISKSGANLCPLASGTVIAGANCMIGVTFVPQTGGAKAASVAITDNASGSPQQVMLTGTGIMPTIQISPSSLGFGSQSVGIPAPAQTISVTNTGNGPLSFGGAGVPSMSFQGANAGDFTETDTCGSAIGSAAPNNSCAISVTFKPQGPGSRSANLLINDNAAGSPQTIPLSGMATQAAVSLSAMSVSFPNQIGGTASAAQTLTLTNTGNGALKVTGISFSGANPTFFSEKDTCSGNGIFISPNAACAVQVTFTPQTDGNASATMTMTDNTAQGSEPISLAGTGVDFSLSAAPGAQTTATVAAGKTATYSLEITGGAGSVALACTGAPSGATCTAPANAQAGMPFSVSVSTARASGLAAQRIFPPRDTRQLCVLQIQWLILFVFGILVAVRTAAKRPLTISVARAAQSLAFAILFAFAISACGGGGGADPGGILGTPPGTYTITVTASAGNTNHSLPLTLIVQ